MNKHSLDCCKFLIRFRSYKKVDINIFGQCYLYVGAYFSDTFTLPLQMCLQLLYILFIKHLYNIFHCFNIIYVPFTIYRYLHCFHFFVIANNVEINILVKPNSVLPLEYILYISSLVILIQTGPGMPPFCFAPHVLQPLF